MSNHTFVETPGKLTSYGESYWAWCSANLETGTWHAIYQVYTDNGMRFVFYNAEDATAFKLKFKL